jgi:APA family basic amino acid/polyamine antiporter
VARARRALERGEAVTRALPGSGHPGETRLRLRRGADEAGELITRGLGAPALFAITLSAIGAALYYALGVVAGDALGLTPIAFLLAGVLFVVTMLSYVEGNSLHPERGGASTFARYAFNELVSFVAGWAVLLDYLIVMAIGSFAVSHYLAAFWGVADDGLVRVLISAATVAFVAISNIRGLSADRLGFVLPLALANLAFLVVLMVVGFVQLFDLKAITDNIELGSAPTWDDAAFGAVVATVALLGIEAASGLAGELRVGRAALRRVVLATSAAGLVVFVGVSALALMAVPVHDGHTALGGRYIEAPVLGVVSAYSPTWVMDAFRYTVGAAGAALLVVTVNSQMLGLSRLAYSLATNRQIPSLIGRLDRRRSTPYVAISIAAAIAFALTLTNDLKFLAGIFAFGAMLAFTIANLSVIRLRFSERDRPSAFRVPLSVRVGNGSVPVPTALGALLGGAAWVSVLVLHRGALLVGGAWMVFGVALYVIYRKGQDKSLTRRFTIPAAALQEAEEVQYGSILVPIFGEELDDDIVGTAGRLAAEHAEEGDGGAVLEAIYVFEIPMSLPIDARVPDERVDQARRFLARAKEVGEEYEGVEVATAMVRGRSAGAAIVSEAKRRGVEAIVLAAEEPTRVLGGAILGGRGRARDRFVGETTRYVVEKAPCKVILTAPPAGDEGLREGVAP